jgi:diguanylate cyclase (GGDEF)-like protein
MPGLPRIFLLSGADMLESELEQILSERQLVLMTLEPGQDLLGGLYSDPPDLMMIDLSRDFCARLDMIKTLRNDSFFSTMPIIGLLDSMKSDLLMSQNSPLDDYLILPADADEIVCRIMLSLSRLKRVFDNNPLTRLPGNTSIQRAIEDAIGNPQAVCYLDINLFKPYNDVYGFMRGDQVLRMLARIMCNVVRDSGGGFCGHVGGDDFVFIVPFERSEMVCQTIIEYFGHIVLDLFDEETKERGYYTGLNRKGEQEQFSLLTISIGVVAADGPNLKHFARVVEVAAELKTIAKQDSKSSYVIDRRKY